MAKDTLPRVGDVVAWAKLEDFTHYTPGPYILVNIHPGGVFLRHLDGGKVTFTRHNVLYDHSGVSLSDLRVDPFLTAARKANLEAKPDEKTETA